MNKNLLFLLLVPFLGFSQVQIGQDIVGKNIGDLSGDALSISSDGNIIAIGSQLNSDNGHYSGHVRVFENILGVWTQLGQDLNGANVVDRFGYSISLSALGNTIAIGSPGNGSLGSVSGHVQVFENVSGVWIQKGQNIQGDVNEFSQGGQSGSSVSLSADGTIVAISSPTLNKPFGSNLGYVKIFQFISGNWVQMGNEIIAEEARDENGFCISISENGSIVAIGANKNDGNGVNSGHVRVFEYISGGWTQIGQDIDGKMAGDFSGTVVSLSADGSVVAIGAPSASASNLGHVRVFKNIAGVWTQIGNDIAGGITGKISIALSGDGDTLIVSSNGVYRSKLYRNVSGSWVEITTIGTIGNFFSVALSSDGTIAAISSPHSSSNRGITTLYDVSNLSNNEFVSQNFNIYPNPTSDILNINLDNNLVLDQVTIYNNLGQVVKTTTENVIDVTNLAKGMYFVEVVTNQGKATKKVVIK